MKLATTPSVLIWDMPNAHQTRLIYLQGECSPAHKHNITEETYLVLSGSGQIQIGSVNHEVALGTYLIVPCNTRHKIINTGLCDLVVISTKNQNINTAVKDTEYLEGCEGD